jgi:hypothetical protein
MFPTIGSPFGPGRRRKEDRFEVKTYKARGKVTAAEIKAYRVEVNMGGFGRRVRAGELEEVVQRRGMSERQ